MPCQVDWICTTIFVAHDGLLGLHAAPASTAGILYSMHRQYLQHKFHPSITRSGKQVSDLATTVQISPPIARTACIMQTNSYRHVFLIVPDPTQGFEDIRLVCINSLRAKFLE